MATEMEPRGQELVSRYKANYHIPAAYRLTEEMILTLESGNGPTDRPSPVDLRGLLAGIRQELQRAICRAAVAKPLSREWG